MKIEKSPVKWAELICANLGWKKALEICTVVGRPKIGKDNETRNVHAPFYLRAKNWIINNKQGEKT